MAAPRPAATDLGEQPRSSSVPLLPVPPYELQPLLFPALPHDDLASSPDPNSPAALAQSQSKAVRCAEGDADNLYVGTSDGIVHAYSIIVPPQGSSTNSRPKYRLRTSRLISNNGKPVERILLLAQLQLAAVLCEGVLSFYTLPSWTPARGLPSTRAVSTVVLDDEEVLHSQGLDGFGMVSLCIVRRKNIILAKVGLQENRDPSWAVIKDIPLPGGAIIARRYGDALCVANTTEYGLINLSDGTLTQLHLPISQTGESPSAQVRPSIVSIPVSRSANPASASGPGGGGSGGEDRPKCEFLVTSHSGSITLGVFVTPSGDPTPKLLEWPSHPRSLVFVADFVFALLRNDTIEVHDVRSDVMEKVQTEHLPPGVEPRFLTAFPTRTTGHQQQRRSDRPEDDTSSELDIVKLDLDSPSTSSLLRRYDDGGSTAAPPQVVLCGRNSVHSLDQDSLSSWGSQRLRKGQLTALEEGLRVVGEERKQRLSGAQPTALDSEARSRSAQYALLLQALALEYLRRARFWEAGEAFSRSGGDPRLLIAFFRQLAAQEQPVAVHQRTASADSKERPRAEAIAPAALQEHVERFSDGKADGLPDIDDLISRNLSMNYCPPLDLATDEVLSELRTALRRRATNMLSAVLRSWRALAAAHRDLPDSTELWCGAMMDDKMRDRVNATVDGTLLNLLAQGVGDDAERAAELQDLVAGHLACPLDEVAGVLRAHSFLSMLASFYEKQQRWDDVLELWTGIIDDRLEDRSPQTAEGSRQPSVSKVAELLSTVDDPSLASKYGTWLVKRDPQAGVRILTKRAASAASPAGSTPKSTKEKELAAVDGNRATLAELTAIDASAADDFVENIVLAAVKTQDAEMHRRLLQVLVRRTEEQLADPEVRARHQRTAVDYAEGSFAESFFAHLALATGAQSEEPHRLRLAMFLQGSTVLDLQEALDAVSRDDLLVYERAVVLGKLGRDKEALSLLAIDLRDANSAEAYCSQDGAVLSPMLANSIAEEASALQPYAALVSRTHAQRSRAAVKTAQRDASHARARKEDLLKTLLTIYMENGKDQTFRTATAHLLNTQASHLDSLEILRLVPDDWPLATLETFLSQSLRRQGHARAEAEVTRSIAVCREFDVVEDSWARLRCVSARLGRLGCIMIVVIV